MITCRILFFIICCKLAIANDGIYENYEEFSKEIRKKSYHLDNDNELSTKDKKILLEKTEQIKSLIMEYMKEKLDPKETLKYEDYQVTEEEKKVLK